VISSGSSIGCFASRTTSAVISLVIEAMGAATSELREYRTEESLWSMISTELDLSLGIKPALGTKPALAPAVAVKAQKSMPASTASLQPGLG
jgi:hypothetical protein